jgi:hypothetical protein
MILIEPHYLPSVNFFSLLCREKGVMIDDISLFKKQSFRNRASIITANGKTDLIVPVKKGKTHTPFSGVQIDYSTKWQRNHLEAIKSAYGKSPFFIYFFDEIAACISRKQELLINLNLGLLEVLSKQAGIDLKYFLLSAINEDKACIDLRDCLHPKEKYRKDMDLIRHVSYMQTFSDRFDFVPGLSIIDLLFNEGPETYPILEQMAC